MFALARMSAVLTVGNEEILRETETCGNWGTVSRKHLPLVLIPVSAVLC
jgi:hypothetical protein